MRYVPNDGNDAAPFTPPTKAFEGRFQRGRRVLVLAAFISFWTAPAFAAEADTYWLRESESEAALADALSSCVVFLKNDTSGAYITGTLLKTTDTFVLTNYHFLDGEKDEVYAYVNVSSSATERVPCIFVKGDRRLDLALFRPAAGLPSANSSLSPGSFADDRDIRRGYRVAFLGFPLNYGLEVEKDTHRLIKRPVFRTGTIASENLDGEFLIGAMVSNGNSGSPVFVRSVNKNTPGYTLIGIIKEYQHDTIKVDLNGKETEIPHNTGLGIVIPIGVIKEFVR